MKENRPFDPDLLRPVDFLCTPDPRNSYFVSVDPAYGCKTLGIDDYHHRISSVILDNEVPQHIAVAFETVKNLYLYSWFVYRFYPVAEHQALACLELALRERYEKSFLEEYPRTKHVTLKPLLKYAVHSGHIKNEGFRRWHLAAEYKARQRYESEKFREMLEKGLDEIVIDRTEVSVHEVDKDFSYVDQLVESLTHSRNHYAHGSKTLHNHVFGTIELVSEIINQIYTSQDYQL